MTLEPSVIYERLERVQEAKAACPDNMRVLTTLIEYEVLLGSMLPPITGTLNATIADARMTGS